MMGNNFSLMVNPRWVVALHLIVVGVSPRRRRGLTPIFMGNFGRRRAQNCPWLMPPDDAGLLAEALALRGR